MVERTIKRELVVEVGGTWRKLDLPPGPQGERGLSAYEVWLNEGHQGSVEDFLQFLRGSRGEKGDTGYAWIPKGGKGIEIFVGGTQPPENAKDGDLWLMEDGVGR